MHENKRGRRIRGVECCKGGVKGGSLAIRRLLWQNREGGKRKERERERGEGDKRERERKREK